jgi:hypothetical protein
MTPPPNSSYWRIPMTRAGISVLGALVTLAVSGCSGTLIREGIWELSFKGRIIQTGEPYPFPKWIVKVLVEANPDGSGEVAEISTLPESPAAGKDVTAGKAEDKVEIDPAKVLKSLYADIQVKREGEPPIVTIHHTDAYWTFMMWGEVRNPEYIVGTRFGARHREINRSMEGYWFMKWLREK